MDGATYKNKNNNNKTNTLSLSLPLILIIKKKKQKLSTLSPPIYIELQLSGNNFINKKISIRKQRSTSRHHRRQPHPSTIQI